MEYTTLGRTELRVSVAGLGCGGNSKIGQGAGQSFDDSVRLVRRALDLGEFSRYGAGLWHRDHCGRRADKDNARDRCCAVDETRCCGHVCRKNFKGC